MTMTGDGSGQAFGFELIFVDVAGLGNSVGRENEDVAGIHLRGSAFVFDIGEQANDGATFFEFLKSAVESVDENRGTVSGIDVVETVALGVDEREETA